MISVPIERTRTAAAQWKKDFKAGFPFVYDPKGTIADAYEVEGIPLNIAIDRNGRVIQVIEGKNDAALNAAVRKLATRAR